MAGLRSIWCLSSHFGSKECWNTEKTCTRVTFLVPKGVVRGCFRLLEMKQMWSRYGETEKRNRFFSQFDHGFVNPPSGGDTFFDHKSVISDLRSAWGCLRGWLMAGLRSIWCLSSHFGSKECWNSGKTCTRVTFLVPKGVDRDRSVLFSASRNETNVVEIW